MVIRLRPCMISSIPLLDQNLETGFSLSTTERKVKKKAERIACMRVCVWSVQTMPRTYFPQDTPISSVRALPPFLPPSLPPSLGKKSARKFLPAQGVGFLACYHSGGRDNKDCLDINTYIKRTLYLWLEWYMIPVVDKTEGGEGGQGWSLGFHLHCENNPK